MMKQITFLLLLLFSTNAYKAQILGCTDNQANNYNANATINDGSCLYNATTVAPTLTISLNDSLIETSGLIFWNNGLYTHNDNSDLNLYQLDTLSGGIKQKNELSNCQNIDWEDISQDSLYLYVGDFGNNVNGNRTNLQILRITKTSLLVNNPIIDTIRFSYSNQTNFTGSGANNTNFDCEAFIVSRDSIFLFTKNWVNKKTTLYGLPKIPGTHIALLKDSFNIQGLVTGATYIEDKRVVALCGYTQFLQPFITLLYDFEKHHFFRANKRRLDVSLPFYQTEGICTRDGNTFYVSNEKFSNSSITTNQKVHTFDLSPYLNSYYYPTSIAEGFIPDEIKISPNPFCNKLSITTNNNQLVYYKIISLLGNEITTGYAYNNQSIDTSALTNGCYFIQVKNEKIQQTFKLIKN